MSDTDQTHLAKLTAQALNEIEPLTKEQIAEAIARQAITHSQIVVATQAERDHADSVTGALSRLLRRYRSKVRAQTDEIQQMRAKVERLGNQLDNV